MAVSKVGLGWDVGERDYNSLLLWFNAKRETGLHETALCSGDLGADFVNITGTDFAQGALIQGVVPYDGSNHTALAKFSRRLVVISTSADGPVIVEHLWIVHNSGAQYAVYPGANNIIRNCYIEHTSNSGINNGIVYADGNSLVQRCVVRALSAENNVGIRPRNNATIDNCLTFGSIDGVLSIFSASTVRDTFAFQSSNLDYNNSNNPLLINNASQDASGNFTGYTSDELVDFANGDYRIKQTSDLFALGIGAFFEEGGGAVESTVAATWPLFQAEAGQSSTAPDITSDIAAQWPIFGVSVSQGAQAPDVDSAITAAWPLFSVQANQASELPQYQATIATTWPLFSASVSQQSEVPEYTADLAATWPLFNVSAEQASQAPVIEITAAVTWPPFTVAANQESQLPEGATSIAVTWPLFGVDASQQSTVPEFDSAIAATWPLFQVSASQQQELPSGATAIAIEWPMFGAQASQESTIPEFTATVAATWPLFSVSILAGEFEFFASPQARVDIPNLSRRVDIPSLSRRIDI